VARALSESSPRGPDAKAQPRLTSLDGTSRSHPQRSEPPPIDLEELGPELDRGGNGSGPGRGTARGDGAAGAAASSPEHASAGKDPARRFFAGAVNEAAPRPPGNGPLAARKGGGPYSTQVRVGLTGMLRLTERLLERMVSAYDNTFRLDQSDLADIYLNMGLGYARGGKGDEASEALRKVLEMEPQNAIAWYELGLVQLRQGATAGAIASLERAEQLGLDGFELHFHHAEALADLERHEEAVEALVKALKKRPDSAQATYLLGVTLDKLERYEEAAAVFRKAIEYSPREVVYYQSLGFTLECLGRRDEAIECFKRALQLGQQGAR
jgi:tetratricopeptide (TPR) repeat protein